MMKPESQKKNKNNNYKKILASIATLGGIVTLASAVAARALPRSKKTKPIKVVSNPIYVRVHDETDWSRRVFIHRDKIQWFTKSGDCMRICTSSLGCSINPNWTTDKWVACKGTEPLTFELLSHHADQATRVLPLESNLKIK